MRQTRRKEKRNYYLDLDYYIIGPFEIFGASWLNYIQIADELVDVIEWDMYATFHTV